LKHKRTIGTEDDYLNIDTGTIGTLTAASKHNLYIREVSGDLYLNTITAENSTVYLEAPQSIFNGQTEGVNITADRAHLIAGFGIGANDSYLKTAVNYLEAKAENGSIWLHNAKNLLIAVLVSWKDSSLPAKFTSRLPAVCRSWRALQLKGRSS
jgi:hypothetical protein